MIKNFQKVKNKLGNIFKILSLNEKKNFIKEVYVTEVNYKKIKGWNFHKKATSNLIVISGKIEFKITKDFKYIKRLILDEKKEKLLSIKPKTWFCFKGLSKKNKILSLSNYKYDRNETKKKSIESNI